MKRKPKSRAIEIAEWLEGPQAGLMGDERVQEAAKILRRIESKAALFERDGLHGVARMLREAVSLRCE